MTQDYIHGYSLQEQHRLVEQTEVLAPVIYQGLDLSHSRSLLEIGCGVGAELAHIHQLWPGAELTGLDQSAGHLSAAQEYLARFNCHGDIRLILADAYALPFKPRSFDTAVTIWLLEHIAHPNRILSEALRVLRPGGRLICTEVDNETLALEPDVPVISRWWRRFNRYQCRAGGDPFVGRRLARIAQGLACQDIRTENLPVICSQFDPGRRRILVDYLETLLLSGAERLLVAGLVEHRQVDEVRDAFQRVRADAGIEVRYFAVRLTCQPPG